MSIWQTGRQIRARSPQARAKRHLGPYRVSSRSPLPTARVKWITRLEHLDPDLPFSGGMSEWGPFPAFFPEGLQGSGSMTIRTVQNEGSAMTRLPHTQGQAIRHCLAFPFREPSPRSAPRCGPARAVPGHMADGSQGLANVVVHGDAFFQEGRAHVAVHFLDVQ